jgi:hypothetical protein
MVPASIGTADIEGKLTAEMLDTAGEKSANWAALVLQTH